MKKSSQFKAGPWLMNTITAAASSAASAADAWNPGVGGFFGMAMAVGASHMAAARETHRKLNIAKRKEYAARNEMKRYKNIYENLQVANPYSNLRNPFENIGLSIDRRKALFERDQFQQGQANMLTALQHGGGGSGMANRVKLLSQMGMEAGARSAASIGQQESQMKFLQPQMFAKIDQLERSGRNISAMFERDKYAKLMGMAQAETFAYGEEKYNQEQARAKNFSAIQQNFMGLAGSTAHKWRGMDDLRDTSSAEQAFSGSWNPGFPNE